MVIKTKLTDSWLNSNAIGTDLTKLVRGGIDTEALYDYVYNRIVRHILTSNELLFDYTDVEDALKGYTDEYDIKTPNAYKYFTPTLKKKNNKYTKYTESVSYTEYRKELFREAQAKLLFEILQGRLSKETALETMNTISKEVESILFDQLYFFYKVGEGRVV
jgi:6-pyruvoyl-tetrahydropterin synthase